jgi:protein arginine N-methyltransferase 1
VLSTSPYAPRTHWDQIYLPLLAPIAAAPGDGIVVAIESETGGDEGGIEVRWTVGHTRAGRPAAEQALSIASGWLA